MAKSKSKDAPVADPPAVPDPPADPVEPVVVDPLTGDPAEDTPPAPEPDGVPDWAKKLQADLQAVDQRLGSVETGITEVGKRANGNGLLRSLLGDWSDVFRIGKLPGEADDGEQE